MTIDLPRERLTSSAVSREAMVINVRYCVAIYGLNYIKSHVHCQIAQIVNKYKTRFEYMTFR